MTQPSEQPAAVPPPGPPPPGPPPPGHPTPGQPAFGHGPPPGYPPPGYGPGPGGPQYVVPPPGYRPPPALSPSGQPLASFVDRLLAYLIDAAIVTVVLLVLFAPAFVYVFVRMIPELPATPIDGPTPDIAAQQHEFFVDLLIPLLLLEAALLLVVLLLYYIYFVEMMFRSGQTVGKKVMKVRVVPLDPAGKLTRGMAARRYLVEVVAGTFLPGFVYVDGLWQLADKPYQQCLHDKFARTVVVKVPA